ncbi:hypothetical protein NQZ79_g2800 [Umbelopsis isabellina]|nr:hypothetical protein NQZ79_g2800 [Umbelopsis isabellina]
MGSATTPQSSYTPSSAKPSSGNPSGNPLKDLIETEKEYLDTLKILTNQIAPIWSNDQRSTDFTELLRHSHDIFKINKRFCARLVKISASPQGIRELGDTLMHWVNEMEAPYANYSRSFINNLNDRQDIVGRPALKTVLQALSTQHSYEITMESLINAPIQRLLYYKILYSRLLETTEPGRSDHQLLAQANKRIDTIMLMAKKNNTHTHVMTSPSLHHVLSPPARQRSLPNAPPPIQTSFSSPYNPIQGNAAHAAIMELERKIDSSTAVDVFSREPKLSTAPRSIVIEDDFVLFPATGNAPPISVHVILLTDVLIITKSLTNDEVTRAARAGSQYVYSLVFPPLAIKHVQFRQLMPERESIGEFYLLIAIRNQDCMHLRADTKEKKSLWLEKTNKQPTTPSQPMYHMQTISSNKPPAPAPKDFNSSSPAPKANPYPEQRSPLSSPSQNRDTIFDMYANIESSGYSKDESNSTPSRDTIFGMYTDEAEDAPSLPRKKSNEAVKKSEGAAVTHEFIKPAVSHTLESIEVSSPLQPSSKGNFFDLPKMDRLNLDDSFSNISSSPPSTAASSVRHARGSDEPESPLPTSPGLSTAPMFSQSVTNAYIAPPTAHNMEIAVSEVSEKPLPLQSLEAGPVAAPIPMHTALQHGQLPPLPPPTLTASKSAPTTHLGPQQMLPPVPSPDPMFMNSAPSSNGAGLMNGGPSGATSPHMRPRPSMNYGGPNYRPPPNMGPYGNAPPPGGPMMHGARPPPPNMMGRPPYPPGQRPMGHAPYPMSPQPPPSKAMGHRPPPLAMQPRPGMPPPGPRPMMHDGRPQDPMLRRSPTHGPPPPPPQGYLGAPPQDNYSFLNVPHQGSPMGSPRSPTTASAMAAVREILHRSPRCEVFRWKDNDWAAVENLCIVEIRQTVTNKPCLAVIIQESNHMYLNAWINRNMTPRQEAPTDVSISIDMGQGRKENYLIHCDDARDANALAAALHRTLMDAITAARREEEEMHAKQVTRTLSRSTSLGAASARKPEDGPQTTKPLMQCRCKMFLQHEHASWTNLGSAGLRLSIQIPSQRVHVYIESEKDSKRLVNSFIQSNFVERVSGNTKRITFRLMNEQTRATAVYMVQVKDDKVGVKIYDFLKGNRIEK